IQQAQLAADNPELGLTMWHLGDALRMLDRFGEAEVLARRVLDIWEQSFGPEHDWTAWALISLAEVRLAQGDAGESIMAAQRAASIVERQFGATHAVLASTMNLHGRAL